MYALELFRMMHPLAVQRLKLGRFRGELDKMTTHKELINFLERHKWDRFGFYSNLTERKQREFTSILDHLGIDLKGKVHLDIGPAYGDTLDLAVSRLGALRADFIELDDVFYTWNRIKKLGHAYRGNHLREIKKLPSREYHCIYARVMQVETMWPLKDSKVGFVRLDSWLAELDRILAPGGTVILVPNWRSGGGKRLSTPDWRAHPFCEFMVSKGYKQLPWIDGHNVEPEFPVTFVRTG